MNTENLDLTPIEWQLYKPAPDKPGYLVFDRNFSLDELGRAIRAKITPELYGLFDYFAPGGLLREASRKRPINATEQPGDEEFTYLATDWSPGNSEGYYTEIYAIRNGDETRKRRVIWTAKTFNVLATIALDICIHCWLLPSRRYQEHAARKILAGIPLQEG